MPIQLAFVPALFVLPPALAPLLVAAALLVARARSTSPRGRGSPSRLLNALADSWFSLGPGGRVRARRRAGRERGSAAVLVARSRPSSLVDALASRAREGLHGGASLGEQLSQSAWIYFVDALLSPLGFGDRARRVDRARGGRPRLAAVPAARGVRPRARRAARARCSSSARPTAAPPGCSGRWSSTTTPTPASTSAASPSWPPRSPPTSASRRTQRRLVEFGALLHDVGKIAIPNEIIQKPGPLDGPSGR